MGTLLSLVCLLSLLFMLLRSQANLKLHSIFDASHLFDFVSRDQVRVSRRAFAMGRLYKGIYHKVERIPGLELPPVFMIVANHQSLADIPGTLMAFPDRPIRFVAKKELKWGVPYVSSIARLGRHALISRSGDFKQGYKELRRLADMSRRGICPLIFPEGTRSKDGYVGRFHSGAVRAVLDKAPMPVLSVAIDGGYKINSLSQLFSDVRGMEYRVKFLKLHPAPGNKAEILEVLATVEKEIDEQLLAWRREELEKR